MSQALSFKPKFGGNKINFEILKAKNICKI